MSAKVLIFKTYCVLFWNSMAGLEASDCLPGKWKCLPLYAAFEMEDHANKTNKIRTVRSLTEGGIDKDWTFYGFITALVLKVLLKWTF